MWYYSQFDEQLGPGEKLLDFVRSSVMQDVLMLLLVENVRL